jgi:hypothetical protein
MPQPIDVQTELARITALERVQQLSDRASLAAHQRASAQAEKQQVEAQTQTQQAEQKSEQIEQELRRRHPYGRRRRKGPAGAREPDADSNAMPRRPPPDLDEHQLDVSV